jgi:hypothetical protein
MNKPKFNLLQYVDFECELRSEGNVVFDSEIRGQVHSIHADPMNKDLYGPMHYRYGIMPVRGDKLVYKWEREIYGSETNQ